MKIEKRVVVTLEGRPEIVDRCLAVLLRVQHLGSWGCSRHIVFSVDGDGIDRLRTDIPQEAARMVWQSNLYFPGRKLFDHNCQIVTDEPQPDPQPEEDRRARGEGER